MSNYHSDEKIISADILSVFNRLSDLSIIEKIGELLPENSPVKDLRSTSDSISANINPIGEVKLTIIEKHEPESIVYGPENSPIKFKIEVNLSKKSESETSLKLTIDADIPFFVKAMLGDKLEEGIDKVADMLTKIKYA